MKMRRQPSNMLKDMKKTINQESYTDPKYLSNYRQNKNISIFQ